MEYKRYTGKHAKSLVTKLMAESTTTDFHLHANQWLNEKNEVKCYVLCEGSTVKTMALLSKCDYDPMHQHSNPYTLNYIYTYPNHRRLGYACKMLIYLKSKEQTTAFCDSDESEALFAKAQYIDYGGPYRYP